MAKTGDILAGLDDSYVEWFENPAQVYNYLEPSESSEDAYGDVDNDARPPHPDNPIETTAQVESPDPSGTNTNKYGISEEFNAEIYLPSEILVHTGGATDDQGRQMPYPTEIVTEGKRWIVLGTVDEGNGRQSAAVRREGQD